MSLYAIHEGETLAALHAYLALRDSRKDDVGTMLAAVPQHPAALLASQIDECRSETTCRHCGRRIISEDGRWIDPEASGDDAVWRETCDAHDTFTAEHEPAS